MVRMVETSTSENRKLDDHQAVAVGARNPYPVLSCLPQRVVTGLIPSIMGSHGNHFIVISHSYHVTIKWAGRVAPLPTLKGGRNHGRKRLLKEKMRED